MRKQSRAVAILTMLALCTMAPVVGTQGGGQAQTPPARRACNLPEPFPCPVARILELRVEPPTINPGESARITWSAENPTNITLSPGRPRRSAGNQACVSVRDHDLYTADRRRAERRGRHPFGDARRAGDSTRRRCRDNRTASNTSDA